jgi:biotin carboxyl carrier protein
MSRVVRAELGGEDTTLRVSESGEVTFEDGKTLRVDAGTRVALVGSTAWVFIDGDVFVIELEDAQRDRARRRDRSSQGALAAPMPATVSKVLVAVGQEVAAGDTLLLLEAMKMELPIKAPHAGRIAALQCQVGELVQPGVPLIEIAAP